MMTLDKNPDSRSGRHRERIALPHLSFPEIEDQNACDHEHDADDPVRGQGDGIHAEQAKGVDHGGCDDLEQQEDDGCRGGAKRRVSDHGAKDDEDPEYATHEVQFVDLEDRCEIPVPEKQHHGQREEEAHGMDGHRGFPKSETLVQP